MVTESVMSTSPVALSSSSHPASENTGLMPGAIVIESVVVASFDSSTAARSVHTPPLVAQTPSPRAASGPSSVLLTTRASGSAVWADAPSTAPTSPAGPAGRLTPRWAVGSDRLHTLTPAGIAFTAGLLANGRWVGVGPP